MNYFIFSLYIITLILIIWDSVVLNINIIKSWKWSKASNTTLSKIKELKMLPNIYILIPVLQEQDVICDTIDHILKMPYAGKKEILIITTEREIHESKDWEGSTPAIVKQCVNNNLYLDVKLLHYPNIKGGKSDQLNFGLDYLWHKKSIDRQNSYIALYDADSRPEINTFVRFSQFVNMYFKSRSTLPTAIQQPSLFMRNFNKVSLYPKLEALFATRWVLGHEIRTQLKSVIYKYSWNVPYAYVVGHGMFIKADFLEKTNGFSVPYDDIHMGQRLDFLGESIHPLPLFDICDIAPSMSEITKQSGRWFGNGLIWSEFLRTRKLGIKMNSIRSITLLFKGLIDSFSWMHYLLHYISLILISYLLPNKIIFVIATFTFVTLDSILGILIMLQYLKKFEIKINEELYLNKISKLLICIYAPFRGIIRGFGPILWLIQQLKYLLIGKYDLPKTARSKN
ncbi:glycosyltransferase [Lysinibacillus sp. NPDC097231]|uniref:glycosyltransferase n=1 Tax=Lysinibacillus sp. NPDC097231 TaxID=3364142 RepID=UPI00382B576C